MLNKNNNDILIILLIGFIVITQMFSFELPKYLFILALGIFLIILGIVGLIDDNIKPT